jgi:SpoVK/Ycf46/Vps4 family AAA+-type ATPase
MQYGRSTLHQLKLIEHQCNDGVADTDGFRLTENAKTLLLSEFELNEHVERVAGLLEHGKITEKQLYFSGDISRRLTDLEELLQHEKYNMVQKRMKDKGFRNGFTVLLYGGPGTGKTETVYQLARKTGRDIMVVDIPNIRDKYVGESEKNIKAVFSRYRAMVKKSKMAPILLFNEADSIIGKRKSGAERAVDKMENAIQNIILQEMETLDGILIATTNLQQNMDRAFERRFLFKIKFDKPSVEARANIWQAMIPELSDFDINKLAACYEFSGGQIENIARLYNVDRILNNECGLDRLIEHCDNEGLEKKKCRPRIGFCSLMPDRQ